MTDVKKQRKNYFVSLPIQGSILARCADYWFVYHLFLWHVMFAYSVIRYQGELAFGGQPQTFLELYASFARQNYTMLLCSIAVFPVLAWDLTYFTHHIAGPLVRLRNELYRLSHDESVEPVRLRKGDLMQEVISAFNLYVEHLNSSRTNHPTSVNSGSSESETLADLQAIQAEVSTCVDGPRETREEQILVSTESKWN
jgi:hypothetical protein